MGCFINILEECNKIYSLHQPLTYPSSTKLDMLPAMDGSNVVMSQTGYWTMV